MSQYTVRSGQNLFDISLALHGSVEGVVDLLVSNPSISFNDKLESGMVLEYNSEFDVNTDVINWFKNKEIVVKNGSHGLTDFDVKASIADWIASVNVANDDEENLITLPTDQFDLEQYYTDVSTPKIMIQQSGKTTQINVQLLEGKFMAVDWGDGSSLQYEYDSDDVSNVAHIYGDDTEHLIRIYGNGEYVNLDFSEVNGIYYALQRIIIENQFNTPYPDSEMLNKLFIVKGQNE